MSGPEIEPITLAEARRQVKLDADLTAEDDLLLSYIVAARELAEDTCKRTFGESVWMLTGSTFPSCYETDGRIILPMGPLIGVDSITYVDRDGDSVLLEQGDWIESEGDMPAWVIPGAGKFWPGVPRCFPGAVRIQYRAGYPGVGSPPDASAIPMRVKQAVKMAVGFWFENRTDGLAGTLPTKQPFGFDDALQLLRVLV